MSEGKAKKAAMSAMDRREHALWLKLANLWDAAEPDLEATGTYEPVVGISSGLCGVLNLWVYGHPQRISLEMGRRMEGRLHDYGERIGKSIALGYLWQRNARGAKRRAAFCRKQAALLERGR